MLAFANFYPSQSLGILTSITILVALVVDFFFFVPLLLVLDERRRHKRALVPGSTPAAVAPQGVAPGEGQQTGGIHL